MEEYEGKDVNSNPETENESGGEFQGGEEFLNSGDTEENTNANEEIQEEPEQSSDGITELANRAKEMEAFVSATRAYVPDNTTNNSNYEVDVIKAKLELMEADLEFKKAEAQFEELNPQSKNYDKEFDNLVYATWKGSGGEKSFSQVATEIKKWQTEILRKHEAKIRGTVDQINSEKKSFSTVKGTPVANKKSESQIFYEKWLKTKNDDDFIAYDSLKQQGR